MDEPKRTLPDGLTSITVGGHPKPRPAPVERVIDVPLKDGGVERVTIYDVTESVEKDASVTRVLMSNQRISDEAAAWLAGQGILS